MNKNKSYICPVCGLDKLAEPLYNNTGDSSYEICVCCGFEFGFDDDFKKQTHDSYRKQWLKNGANWFNPKLKPINWNPEEQLKNLRIKK